MKKYSLTGLMLFVLLAFIPSSGHAVGRLNFMLTNLTGLDITDVRIAPTYYPNYISENLLKTNLDPNTRLYIGPNYYGDQRFWNITVSFIYQSQMLAINRAFIHFCTVQFPNIKGAITSSSKDVIQLFFVFNQVKQPKTFYQEWCLIEFLSATFQEISFVYLSVLASYFLLIEIISNLLCHNPIEL